MPRAHALFEECLALYTSLGNKQGIDEVLFNMAYLAQGEADYQRARTLFEEILAHQTAIGNNSIQHAR
jgi:hypothetical protein